MRLSHSIETRLLSRPATSRVDSRGCSVSDEVRRDHKYEHRSPPLSGMRRPKKRRRPGRRRPGHPENPDTREKTAGENRTPNFQRPLLAGGTPRRIASSHPQPTHQLGLLHPTKKRNAKKRCAKAASYGCGGWEFPCARPRVCLPRSRVSPMARSGLRKAGRCLWSQQDMTISMALVAVDDGFLTECVPGRCGRPLSFA